MTVVGARMWRDVAKISTWTSREHHRSTNGLDESQARWPCTQPEVKVAFVTARWVGLRVVSVFLKWAVGSPQKRAIRRRCGDVIASGRERLARWRCVEKCDWWASNDLVYIVQLDAFKSVRQAINYDWISWRIDFLLISKARTNNLKKRIYK